MEGCLLTFVLIDILKLYGNNYVSDLIIYFVIVGIIGPNGPLKGLNRCHELFLI